MKGNSCLFTDFSHIKGTSNDRKLWEKINTRKKCSPALRLLAQDSSKDLRRKNDKSTTSRNFFKVGKKVFSFT